MQMERDAISPRPASRNTFFTSGGTEFHLGIGKSNIENVAFWYETAETGNIFETQVALTSGHENFTFVEIAS